ncbi:MAG TPA: hypothetical protein VFJ74_07740, partial [Gemmatimonadaceae bacterium]|nr:hypothetical protein [Gemmatimonadaceae bacterium]
MDFLPPARRAARALSLLSALAVASRVLPAQTARPAAAEPPRPPLAAGADTNDAEAYLSLAREQLSRDSKRAAAAAYWATRIDPTSAPALLVRWHAELNAARWQHIVIPPDEALRIDSLPWRAMMRDPFASPDPNADAILGPSPAAVRAELQRHPDVIPLRVLLAARFYARQQFDSTVAELRTTLDALARLDTAGPRHVYQSREVFHYAIAKALYAAGRRDEARAEFAAALGENVAFYPAHATLGSIAWTQWSDIDKAREEFGFALELRDDAVVHYDYGTVLLQAARFDEALAQLDRAIALEPYFANSYANRAVALDRLGRGAEASAAYEQFVARAPRRMAAVAAAAHRRAQALAGATSTVRDTAS